MFESNTDFDFDDEIFANAFEPQSSQVEATKRTVENENLPVETKRLCIESKNFTPTHSMFLKTINGDFSKAKAVSEAKAGPSVTTASLFECRLQFEKTLQSSNSPIKKVVSRKFPGPAGLLPERRDLNIDIKALEEVNKEAKQDSVDMDIVFSQMSAKAFQEGPWEKMSKDFRRQRLFLPDKYNIAWIKSKAKANKLINQKAPFLAAIIQNIECLSLKTPIAKMLLKDATGQIHATMIHDLYEEYIKFLKIGSVIILKQVSVLTTDHGSKHLTITANNLVTIYSPESNVDNVSKSNETSPEHSQNETLSKYHAQGEGSIHVVTIQKFFIEDFLKNINEVKCKYEAALLEQKLNSAMDFENIVSNLRSSPQANASVGMNMNLATRASLQRTTSQSDHKSMSPNYRNLSSTAVNCDQNSGNRIANKVYVGTRTDLQRTNIHSDNKAMSSNRRNLSMRSTSCDRNSVNSNISVTNVDNNNSSNLLNKENVKLVNCQNKPRFNFKAQLNKKPNESSVGGQLTQLITEFKSASESSTNCSDKSVSDERSSIVTCSQISIRTDNLEHSAILQNVFEGIDADSLFEDF